eukprot:TRINITY_DN3895_c0_g2_i1.p1 TRINITY_DN3895_c0_g2~~TRINITY_DN3895_c0_g2_i1.p1  ORF type:complete len:337 (+),score=49.29 TRINITY_DN3895_c0_g2_i1:59-1069(+)
MIPVDGEKMKEWSEATIVVVGARDLVAKDFKPLANKWGTSDPYVKLKTNKHIIVKGEDRTSVVRADLNPTWNEVFEVKFSHRCSEFKFKLYDKDKHTEDDDLGKVSVPLSMFFDKLSDISTPVTIDQWFALRKVEQGGLHLRITVQFKIPIVRPGMIIPLPEDIKIGLAWDFKKKDPVVDLDASVAGLDDEETIKDVVSFKNLSGFGGVISHSGDDRTGEGDGDDETISVRLNELPEEVDKLVIVVNSYTEQPLSKVKYAYIRIFTAGENHVGSSTIAFCGLGKGKVPATSGLFFGVVKRSGNEWNFQVTNEGAPGQVVEQSLPTIKAYGKAHLGW